MWKIFKFTEYLGNIEIVRNFKKYKVHQEEKKSEFDGSAGMTRFRNEF